MDAVEAVTRELGVALGATEVSFLIADLSGRALVRLAHVPLYEMDGGMGGGQTLEPGERRDAEEHATVLPFDGGPAEQAVRTQTVQVLAPDGRSTAGPTPDQWTVLAPMTERGEVIGLLELRIPQEPDPQVLAEITRLAHLLAFVVIANRRHTDSTSGVNAAAASSLSAEIQQRLLPGPRTCEAGAFTLSAWLEPAAEIAGDTFDYSLARDMLHLSMTDAMGHGVAAALTASLCVGGLRGARRQGATVARTGVGHERGPGGTCRRNRQGRLRHWPDRAPGPTRGIARTRQRRTRRSLPDASATRSTPWTSRPTSPSGCSRRRTITAP